MNLAKLSFLAIVSLFLFSCSNSDSGNGNKNNTTVTVLDFPKSQHMASNCIFLNGVYDYAGTVKIQTKKNGNSIIYNYYSTNGESKGMSDFTGEPIHFSNDPANISQLNGCYEFGKNTLIQFDNTTNVVKSSCIQTLDSSMNIVMNCTGCDNGQCGSQQIIYKKIQ